MTARWYVLQSKPHKEKIVTRLLQDQGFDAVCPCVGGKATKHRDEKTEPYFQSYLFVRADLDQINLSALLWMPNTIGLVCLGDEPVHVPDAIVTAIRHRLKTADLDVQTIEPQKHSPTANVVPHPSDYERVSDSIRILREQLPSSG
ncbi:MAG: hypothetical protein KKD28_10655 [Chloroflexi bacterium]|nr:hypothetical protein [Chloroflexota bacterium]MBU1661916.1 hypothetical protein [Chloroflexota bacterium]